jgi:hypothetical protein
LASQPAELFYSSASKEQILGSHSRHVGQVEAKDIAYAGKNLFVVLVDVGSGLSRKNLYIYVSEKPGDSWKLLAFRSTNSASLTVETTAAGIRGVSKNGKTLVFIPVDALSLAFDPAEQ